MRRWGLRILGALALAYAAAVGGLYAAQDRFIYPAPQTRHAPAPGFAAETLATEDSLVLQAHWRAPAEGRPSIVFFHGNGGSLALAAQETQGFVAEGYGVLLVEYRGYGGNPGSPSEDGFYRDGRAAMAFLRAKGIAPARTVIIGHSLGTGTASQMAKEFAPVALILLAPFTSLPDAAAEALPFVPARWLVRGQFDNLAKVPGLALPVLILHGNADRVVPFALGARLAKVAPRATFRALAGAGHMISMEPEVQAAQLVWLAAQGL